MSTDVWLTPPWLLEPLGEFDLDPSSPVERPWPTAHHHYTALDDGLALPWFGRVWLNPPYGRSIGRWLARMARHNHGLALIFARTDTAAFHRCVWEVSTALLFIRGRVEFLRQDGTPMPKRRDGRPQNAAAPSVLCAYGSSDADVLAGCGLDGHFVPLRLPRAVLLLGISSAARPTDTWRDVVVDLLRRRRGPVSLADLYRVVARHPKAGGNRNFAAKVRQVLQLGPFRRVARGRWELAA
jgi:hypothetical protein